MDRQRSELHKTRAEAYQTCRSDPRVMGPQQCYHDGAERAEEGFGSRDHYDCTSVVARKALNEGQSTAESDCL